MKKTILLIPVLFIAISVIVSCTKTCNCSYVSNGKKILKGVEMEKYAKNCKDQSESRDTVFYLDSLGNERIKPDSVPRVICE